jgi:hypothetical protein
MLTRIRALIVLLTLPLVFSYHRLQAVGLIRFLNLFRGRFSSLEEPSGREVLAVLPFSTHPLFAPLILGRVLKILSLGQSPEEAKRCIVGWMGTFSAFGDILYYRGWIWVFSSGIALVLLFGLDHLALWLILSALIFEVLLRVALLELGVGSEIPFPDLVQRMKLPVLRNLLPLLGYLGWVAVFLVLIGIRWRTVRWEEFLFFFPALCGGVALALWTRFRSLVFWVPFALIFIRSLLKYV